MVQCAACRTEMKASQVKCHACGALAPSKRTPSLPKLNPFSGLDTEEDFKTLITQREQEESPPKTLPMVPPPFTPPPQIVAPALLPPQEDSFEVGLGDFTEIAEHIPADEEPELPEDELDHTVDLEPEEFYSLDGEMDITPFPTAQLISPPGGGSQLPAVPKVPASSMGSEAKPRPLPNAFVPKPPAPPALRASASSSSRRSSPLSDAEREVVSSLLVLAHKPARAKLERGMQRFGAQYDPTGGLLEELYPHHFSVKHSEAEVLLCPVSGEAELWLKAERRSQVALGEVIRAGHTKLTIAHTGDVLKPVKTMNQHLPQAQVNLLSLLAFNSEGLLEGVYPLQEGVTRIGRGFADITLSDPGLSLSHAALLLEQGQVTLVDLGSESGLWRQVHQPTPLKRGAVFSAGHTLFVAR